LSVSLHFICIVGHFFLSLCTFVILQATAF